MPAARTGTVLIFDEVITGFRLGIGGAQGKFRVTPDLAVFGKALASGFPVSALAGRAEIMDLTHKGGVMHGGTYNAHPAGMAATVATLTELATSDAYALIEKRGRRLMDGIAGLFRDYQVIAHVQGFPAVFPRRHRQLDAIDQLPRQPADRSGGLRALCDSSAARAAYTGARAWRLVPAFRLPTTTQSSTGR